MKLRVTLDLEVPHDVWVDTFDATVTSDEKLKWYVRDVKSAIDDYTDAWASNVTAELAVEV